MIDWSDCVHREGSELEEVTAEAEMMLKEEWKSLFWKSAVLLWLGKGTVRPLDSDLIKCSLVISGCPYDQPHNYCSQVFCTHATSLRYPLSVLAIV